MRPSKTEFHYNDPRNMWVPNSRIKHMIDQQTLGPGPKVDSATTEDLADPESFSTMQRISRQFKEWEIDTKKKDDGYQITNAIDLDTQGDGNKLRRHRKDYLTIDTLRNSLGTNVYPGVYIETDNTDKAKVYLEDTGNNYEAKESQGKLLQNIIDIATIADLDTTDKQKQADNIENQITGNYRDEDRIKAMCRKIEETLNNDLTTISNREGGVNDKNNGDFLKSEIKTV